MEDPPIKNLLIKISVVGLLLFIWGILSPTEKAHAQETIQLETTTQPAIDTATVVAQIIESANSTIAQAETTTAQVKTNAQAITSPTETITATIATADQSILQAKAVVDSATVAISNKTSAETALNTAISEKNTALSNLETATALVNSQTQIVATDSATVLAAQTAVDGSTVTVQTSGLTAQVYNVQGQNNAPTLPVNAQPISTTTVPYIYFYWGTGQILNSGRSEDVIVKFTGQINAPENATSLRYAVYSDDGSRLYIDGQNVIDNWWDQGPTWSEYSNWFDVTTDKNQNLELWYYENGGGANVVLGWDLIFSDGSGYFTSPTETAFTTTTVTQDPALVQALNTAKATLATDTAILNTYTSQKTTAEGIATQKNQAATIALSNLTSATNAMNQAVSAIAPAISNLTSSVSAANSTVNNTLAQEEAARQAAIRAEQERQAAIAAENARIAAQQAYEAEQARLKAEAEAKAAEEAAAKAEADRLAAEAAAAKAEADRLAAEQAAAEQAEKDRLAEEAAAKAEAEAKAQAEADAQAEAEAKAQEEANAKAEAEAKAAEEAAQKAEEESKQAEQDAIDKEIEKAIENGTLTEEQKEIIVDKLLEDLKPGESLSASEIKEAGIEYKDLPPETPVDVRTDSNGNAVVITAETAANIELILDPGALVDELLSNPLNAIGALGSIGADMSPQEREKAEDILVATVLVGQVIVGSAIMRRN